MTTYCTAQSLILQLISSADELLVLLCVVMIECIVGAGGGSKVNMIPIIARCAIVIVIKKIHACT